jgi:hypothetical protein
MGQEIVRPIGRNHLCVSLIEQGECTSGGTGVDGLPQPVEHKDRLIKQSIHDLGDAEMSVPISPFPWLSIMSE